MSPNWPQGPLRQRICFCAVARLAIVAVVAVLAMATASADAAPQGVSDDEIVIGTHQDLSGPITFWGVPVRNGMMMAVADINAAGGIHGRKLKLVVEDNGYDPKKAVLATQKMLTRDKIFMMAGAMGTPTVLASMPAVLKKGLPHVFPLTAAEQMYEPFHKLKFSSATPYYFGIRAGVKYLVAQEGIERICSLHQDDEFGLNNHRGAEDQAAAMGKPLVETVTYKRGATDFSSQVAKLKAADCQLVALGTIIRETVGVMAEARKTGFDALFLAGAAGYAPEVAALGKDAVEGLYGVGQALIPYEDTASPEVRDWMRRYKAAFDADANVQAVYGYLVMELVAEGLRRAGPELTAESFAEGVEQIRDWQPMFDASPLTFTPEQHLGTKQVILSQIRDGRWHRVAGPIGY